MGRLLLLLLFAGCLKSQAVICGDGRTCPPNSACDDIHGTCVAPDQLVACVDIDDGTDCVISGGPAGICRDHVCIEAGCGDGFRRGNELCDGNDLGAMPNCTDHEFYDTGQVTCTDACNYSTTTCTGFCGDQMVNGDELCDGSPPVSQTCVGLGYDAGFLDCNRCGPGLADCKLLEWELQYVAPAALRDVHGTTEANVHAVGKEARVMRFNGLAWNPVDVSSCLATTGELFGVWTTGPSQLVAVGQDASAAGVALVVDGQTCTSITGLSTTKLADVWAASASDVFAVGAGIHHFDGTTWSSTLTAEPFTTVWGVAVDDVYAGSTRLLHFDGTTWTPVTIPGVTVTRVTRIWGTSASNVHVAIDTTAGVRIARFDGTVWTASLRAAASATALTTTSSGRLVMASGSAVDARIASAWTDLAYRGGGVTGLWGAPDGSVFASASTGHIQRFMGGAWDDSNLDIPTIQLFRIAAASANEAAGLQDVLYRWDGRAWGDAQGPATPTDISFDPASGALYLLNASGLWRRPASGSFPASPEVAATGSFIHAQSTGVWIVDTRTATTKLRFWDGSQLQCATCDLPATEITALWNSEAGNAIAVGRAGKIYRWNGSAWSTMTSGTSVHLWDVWGSAENDVYAVGDNGTVLHHDGSSWQPLSIATGANGMYGVAGFSSTDVFVAGEWGVFFHYDGTRWTRVRNPAAQEFETLRQLVVAGGALFALDDAGIVHRLVRTLTW